MLVADGAENLLEHVLQRHEAHDSAELVHHHGHVFVRVAELVDQLVQRFGLRRHQRFAEHALQPERPQRALLLVGGPTLFPDPHHVFVVDIPDDVLGIALIDGQAGVLMFPHEPEDLVQTGVHRHGHYGVARDHDFPRVVISQFEQGLNGVLFEAVQVAFVATRADDELQLFGRVAAAAVAAAQADPFRERLRGAFHNIYEWR